LPKDNAPANAPKKEIIIVPISKELKRFKRLDSGKYNRKTIDDDKIIKGSAENNQFTIILINTICNIEKSFA
jgi:hypothetical protein